MSIVLPPEVSERSLERAVQAFRDVVGPDHVLTEPDQMREFRDPFWHADWDDYEACAVVQPGVGRGDPGDRAARQRAPGAAVGDVAGAQQRLRGLIAPGARIGRGEPAADEPGARRSTRSSGYAEVEPGVSWYDLYAAIQAGGHRLMLSCADLGWGSVIGNTLDHGCTYLPYGVDMSAACGLEVVLASGELLRTGMGAMPGNRAWHTYKRGLGPTLDQLFMQSNYGIVTKMGVWLMPYPETYMPIWVRAWNDDDLAPLVDTLRRLSLDDTIRMIPQVCNTLIYASFMTRRTEWWDGDGPIPDEVIDRIARELEVGRWMMRAALYGDEAVVDHRFAKVKAAFERIPGVEVWGTKTTPEDAKNLEHPAERIQGGVPDLEMNAMTGWYGGEGVRRPRRLLPGGADDRP